MWLTVANRNPSVYGYPVMVKKGGIRSIGMNLATPSSVTLQGFTRVPSLFDAQLQFRYSSIITLCLEKDARYSSNLLHELFDGETSQSALARCSELIVVNRRPLPGRQGLQRGL